MSTILASVSTENIEWTKLLLNVLYVAATIGVWAGVWLEGKNFSELTQEIGWKLLIACLGTEAIFGLAMLQLDSEIAGRQKLEVARLTIDAAESNKLAGEARNAPQMRKSP
jgi:hypothetical protein